MIVQNNKKIAKNSLLLFARMIFQTIISLFTSRIILEVLGVSDFGIYAVVGSVIALFSIVEGTLRSSTTRFISVEVGKGKNNSINKVYSTSLIFYIILAVLIIIIGKTIGEWFVKSSLSFPLERMNVVLHIFNLSLITFCIKMFKIPYESIIISHEKFNYFTIIGLIFSTIQLLFVLSLKYLDYDKLILYALFMLILALFELLLVIFFSYKTYPDTSFKLKFDKNIAGDLFSFSSWTLLGSTSQVSSIQAINIFINIFLGVTVNTSISLANQVKNTVYNFVSNFQTAFHPQLTQLVSNKDFKSSNKVVFLTTKASFYIIFAITLPIFFKIDFLLSVWLVEVPRYTSEFVLLILIFSLIDSLAGPLYISALAYGDIKKYQIFLSLIILINIPLIYAILQMKFEPYWIFVARIGTNLLAYVFRIFYLKNRIKLNLKSYYLKVIKPILNVTISAVFFTLLYNRILSENNWIEVFFFTCLSSITFLALIYFIGISKKDRINFQNFIKLK